MLEGVVDVPVGDVSRVAAGGGDRLAELYRAVTPRAVRLAYLITSDQALAEDVVQDAFIRVASRLNRLRDPNAFEAYLRRAVVNEILGARRSAGRREQRQRRATGTTPSSYGSHTDQVHDRIVLLGAVNELPVHQRTIILLKFWADLSDREIADTMNCALGTVKSRLARSLEALRQVTRDE